MTKANQDRRENHHYSVYGYESCLLSTQTVTSFNGEAFDPVSACYLLGLGYRAYSPSLRRFLTVDSWSPFGQGGLNGYSYCAGDPINRHDPSGHMYESKFVKLQNGQRFKVTKNMAVAVPPKPATVHKQPGPSEFSANTNSSPSSRRPNVRELISQFNGATASGQQSQAVEARTSHRAQSAPPVLNSQQSAVPSTHSRYSRESTPVSRTPSPTVAVEMPHHVKAVAGLRERGLERTVTQVREPSSDYPKAPPPHRK